MGSIFTKIMAGELPGRFVWKDDSCAAFLTIEPLRPGHTLVVPRLEVDHWIDLEPDLLGHLVSVSHKVASGIQVAWQPEKVGLMIAGLEVRHVHIHVTPIWGLGDLAFANIDRNTTPDSLDAAAHKLRETLRAAGHAEVSS